MDTDSFIMYTAADGEVLITTPYHEKECLLLWFTEGGRLIDDWDRTTSREAAIEITARVHAV